MAGWTQAWRERVLRAGGVPVTQYALDVLSAWRRSTPTEPWTNNPLGHPARGSGAPEALDTPYAMFPTINDFTAAMKRLLKSPAGKQLLHTLITSDSYATAWREIHALKWPANLTESDYPAVLLDMVEQTYRDKLSRTSKEKRKTAGTQQASPDVHMAVRQQGYALHDAMTSFGDGRKAIAHIVRSLG